VAHVVMGHPRRSGQQRRRDRRGAIPAPGSGSFSTHNTNAPEGGSK
jgi:hypothetical protein